MPELPEVETIRRQLAPAGGGHDAARGRDPRPALVAPLAPAELADALVGRRVERAAAARQVSGLALRRARSTCSAPADDRRRCSSSPTPSRPHSARRAQLRPRARACVLRRPAPLRHRRAGARRRRRSRRSSPRASALEPFDERFTAEHLRALARGRSGADQGVPARPAADRRRRQHLRRRGAVPRRASTRCAPPERCARAVRAPARRRSSRRSRAGIDARGASIDDFRHLDGVRGSFQDRFLVHRREGEPCPRCGTTIVKIVVGGRGTYVCESCQPRPALGRVSATWPARARPRASVPASCSGACSGGEQLVEAAASGRRPAARSKPPSSSPPIRTCGNVIIPVRCASSTRPSASIARLISSNSRPRLLEQGLRLAAERARLSGIDGDLVHYFTSIARA